MAMTMNVFTVYTQYFVMASTQLPSGLLGDSIALLLPSNQVPSGADLKVKSPSAATVTQPNRYHLDMMQFVIVMLKLASETYSLLLPWVTDLATIFFSFVFTPFVILISQPLSRKDCPLFSKLKSSTAIT